MNGQPNILVILTDQQSSTMMSCAGNRYLRTPAMDSLAAAGVRFDLAFCADPVCVPSRFSLFTGRYPSEIGQRSNATGPAELVTDAIRAAGMGHLVKAAGYEALYGGKEHLPHLRAADLGFDYFCKDERDELATVCATMLRERPAEAPPFLMVASFINPHDICYMAIREHAKGGPDARILERGKVEVAEMVATLELRHRYDEAIFWDTLCPPLPANHAVQEDEPEAVGALVDERPFRRGARDHWDDRTWRLHRWAYHRLTERVDGQIATVLAALRESDLAENTVVIFTSDHGDHDSSHRLEHKTALYEEATRIPLIVADPRTAVAGSVNREALVCNGTDLLATVCDYAGAVMPSALTGRSVRPWALGESPTAWRDHLRIESQIGYGIRTKDYFYAIHDTGANREQLYDLRRDPGQTRNAAHDPEQANELARHRALARQHAPMAGLVP